jgi:hypothetical protein
MKNGASSTDVAKKLSLVSVHTNEQTLTIDFIFYVICWGIHNRIAKIEKNIESHAILNEKFGSYRKNIYLCSVRTSVLTTPLSAGSKT